ncbi:MAG TPA: protein-glutamate O-methyltransferase CheR [Polyangiaceae bacterium]
MPLDIEVEEIEMRLLLEGIHARYGYDFRDYAQHSLSRRLKGALVRSGLPDYGALQHRVLTEPEIFASLVDDLTVQVSEMFRDPPFYRVFREKVVPVLRTHPQIKIWHAGCAGGEELYATAIVLLEENLYDRAQIYATDMSMKAVEQAREGIYSEEQASLFAENYRRAGGQGRFEDYYSSAYGRIAMHETLRRNAVFFQHDLVSDYALGEMQVVFCRNVMIYFSDKLRQRVLTVLGDGLRHGGFLCLGSSERLPTSSLGGFAEFAPAERIYRRRGDA